MSKYCPECGAEVNKDYKFCVKCGSKSIHKKLVKKESETIADKKTTMFDEESRLNRVKEKIKGWKKEGYHVDEIEQKIKSIEKQDWQFKRTFVTKQSNTKISITVIALVCLVAVVGASIPVFSPFYTTSSVVTVGSEKFGGRIFTVPVENIYGSEAECYLKVGGLRYGESFTVSPGEIKTISIMEDDLFLMRDAYEITLVAAVDYDVQEITAIDVTDDVAFSIYDANGQFFIECIDSD